MKSKSYSLLAIFILFFPPTLFSQKYEIYNGDTINLTDSTGMKQGLWISFNKDESVNEEIIYIDDKLHGAFKKYFANGILKLEEEYQNGSLKGAYTYYYPNGSIKEHGSYKNGKVNGWQKIYFSEQGKVSEEGNRIDGLRDGEWTFYDKNSSMYIKGIYKNDLKEGIWNEYDSFGNKKKQITYNKGTVIVSIEIK